MTLATLVCPLTALKNVSSVTVQSRMEVFPEKSDILPPWHPFAPETLLVGKNKQWPTPKEPRGCLHPRPPSCCLSNSRHHSFVAWVRRTGISGPGLGKSLDLPDSKVTQNGAQSPVPLPISQCGYQFPNPSRLFIGTLDPSVLFPARSLTSLCALPS